VEEVVDATLRAAESEAYGPYNVGRGVETSVLELIEALEELGGEAGLLADGSFVLEMAPARPGEVLRNALDTKKAREVLGFEAKVGLKDGLRVTLDSFR
jgi:nucleoside-diphosphate-sugar epimerase